MKRFIIIIKIPFAPVENEDRGINEGINEGNETASLLERERMCGRGNEVLTTDRTAPVMANLGGGRNMVFRRRPGTTASVSAAECASPRRARFYTTHGAERDDDDYAEKQAIRDRREPEAPVPRHAVENGRNKASSGEWTTTKKKKRGVSSPASTSQRKPPNAAFSHHTKEGYRQNSTGASGRLLACLLACTAVPETAAVEAQSRCL